HSPGFFQNKNLLSYKLLLYTSNILLSLFRAAAQRCCLRLFPSLILHRSAWKHAPRGAFFVVENSITRLSDEMMIAANFSEISPAARAQVFPFFSACILLLICYNSIKNTCSF
ncbi:MAG: hypothetical protein ACLUJC_12330, partial [Clostridia bacterium]